MAVREPARRKTYVIPDNFIDESRIINGMFRTRYFVEATAMALVAAGFALNLIPVTTVSAKITSIVFVAGPFFAVGIAGIGGDPVSVVMKNVFHWLNNRTPILYDTRIRALVSSPLERMMSETPTKDQILDYVEKVRQQHLENRLNQELIEGETFQFANDTDRARKYIDLDKEAARLAKIRAAETLEMDYESILVVSDDDEEKRTIPSINVAAQDNADWDFLDFLEYTPISISPEAAIDFERMGLLDVEEKQEKD